MVFAQVHKYNSVNRKRFDASCIRMSLVKTFEFLLFQMISFLKGQLYIYNLHDKF